MRKNKLTFSGILLGSRCGLDMAGQIAAQIELDGVHPHIFYWHQGDLDAEQMAEAIATLMKSQAKMIPNGTMLADVQFCLDDAEANQGNFAIVGSFYDDVVPHLRHIGPKKGTKKKNAFEVLSGVVDGGETQVITLKLLPTSQKKIPTAKCSIVHLATATATGTGEKRKKAA